MVFSIKKVKTPADKYQFIHLPWQIYSDFPCWVPPLVSERKNFLNPKANPFLKESDVDLFLVVSEDQKPVGRVAFIINNKHNEINSERVGFFGMFEAINDRRVSGLLLNTLEVLCRKSKLKKILGPVSLSTNHECGLLIDGFETPPVVGMPYNPPYYVDLLESWGLTKEKDLVSLRLDLIKIPEYLDSAIIRLNKRKRFITRSIRLNKFNEEIEIIWGIYNSSWNANWGFVPMSKQEFKYAANEMKSFIRSEFCFIAEVNGEPAGFSLALPNINEVLKKINGSLFPLGWIKFLWSKSDIKIYRVVALGVNKKYRRLGIDAQLYYETYKKLLGEKIQWCDMSWVLEDNKDILIPMNRLGGNIYKRHRIYGRNILP